MLLALAALRLAARHYGYSHGVKDRYAYNRYAYGGHHRLLPHHRRYGLLRSLSPLWLLPVGFTTPLRDCTVADVAGSGATLYQQVTPTGGTATTSALAITQAQTAR